MRRVRQNTVLPNKVTFCRVFGLLRLKAQRMRYWCEHRRYRPANFLRRYRRTPTKSGPVTSLSYMDEFTLTPMKLRLSVTSDGKAKWPIAAPAASTPIDTHTQELIN